MIAGGTGIAPIYHVREIINKSKKPIIGICLGMQLMFSKSFENGVTKGLNLFKGEVVKLNTNKLNIWKCI